MEATPQSLSVLQARNKKITLFFSFLFASLFLSISAIIFYLVLDITSESARSSFHPPPSPILTNPNLTLTLQAAAVQLQGTIPDPLPGSTLNNCSNLLRAGLGQIQLSIEDQGDRRREMTRERIVRAERDVESCLRILEKVQAAAKVVRMARRKVWRGYREVQRCGDLANRVDWSAGKAFGWVGSGIFRAQYPFMVFLGGMQLSVVGYMFWILQGFGYER